MSMFVVNFQNYWKILFRSGYSLRNAEHTAWYIHYIQIGRDHASVLSYISELFLTRVFLKCIWWCYHILHRFAWFYFAGLCLPPLCGLKGIT